MTEYTGGCTCRAVRYALTDEPMFVHGCHCRWCQRETGASFALNALIEFDRMELMNGTVETFTTPSNSDKDHSIVRCPTFLLALLHNYGGVGDRFRFVRVGTLDAPDRFAPDVHIFTASK